MKLSDLTSAPLVGNLKALYRTRTESDDILGRAWYDKAHRIVLEWADSYGYPIATVASVIAAVSPQCPWERNLIIADDILAHRPPSIGAIQANVRKAQTIRDKRLTNTLSVMPQGPKVASFAANLAGDYSFVTVDTHAFQAALNDVATPYTVRGWQQYDYVSRAYMVGALATGLDPAVFQAIIWHVWKRLHPPEAKRRVRRQWEPIGTLED